MTTYKALSPVLASPTHSVNVACFCCCAHFFFKLIVTVSLSGTFITSCWNSSCYRQLLQGKKHLQLERPNELTGHPLRWHHPGKPTRYMWWPHSESLRHTQQYHCVSHKETFPNRFLLDGCVTLRLCPLSLILKKKKKKDITPKWKLFILRHERDFFVTWGLLHPRLSLGSPRSSF